MQAACGGFKPEVVVDPVANIDAGDIGNQLAVVDYIEDIYSFYRKAEVEIAQSHGCNREVKLFVNSASFFFFS